MVKNGFVFQLLEGKPIPTELRKDEAELRKAIEFDDEKHERKLINISLERFPITCAIHRGDKIRFW